ncbi:MAG: hypothetical protein JNM17_13140 [Archangium sp.]|nr:hypothetical protein [Archangium sp.]
MSDEAREHERTFAELPAALRNSLSAAGIRSVEALSNKSLIEMQRTKNIGPKGIAALTAFLERRDLKFRDHHASPRCLCRECPIHRGTAPAPDAPHDSGRGGGVAVTGGVGASSGAARE